MEKKTERIVEKWGEPALEMGWTAIPTTLFFLQNQLEITPLGMNIILNLVTHWWSVNENPYPAQEALAARMGVSKRSIQREMKTLIDQGLISKKPSSTSHPKYRGRNAYDLSPLVKILEELSPPLVASMKKRKDAASRSTSDEPEGDEPPSIHAGRRDRAG